MLDLNDLKDRLGEKLVCEVDRRSKCIITSLFYPNGDSINLYFHKRGKNIEVSDDGATMDALSFSGIELTAERKKLLQTICDHDGAKVSKNVIHRTLGPRSSAPDCLQFLQTLTHVTTLHFQHEHPPRSRVHAVIDNLLAKKVRKKRPFVKNWNDPKHDPDAAFPVDYHFNGSAPARNLFYVSSDQKALLVTAVVQFLRARGTDYETMAVVDKGAVVRDKQMERLQVSSNELVFGVVGHERSIVKFALGA